MEKKQLFKALITFLGVLSLFLSFFMLVVAVSLLSSGHFAMGLFDLVLSYWNFHNFSSNMAFLKSLESQNKE